MGPVAQLVFKTSAVVQPTARSVRLRRRSVHRLGTARAGELVAGTLSPGIDQFSMFPRQAPVSRPRPSMSSLKDSRSPLTRWLSSPMRLPIDSFMPSGS